MAVRRIVDERTLHCHVQCAHCVPNGDFLSFVTGLPIIGGCGYRECGFLLDERVECENFKKK